MSETFDTFLAARPQLERSSLPIPGLCVCPDRFEIDEKTILVRHSACDNTGYSWVDISGKGGALMRETTLEALAAWIPVPPPAPDYDDTAAQYVIHRMIELGFHLVKLHPGRKKPMGAAWNSPETTPALTEDQALAHVRAGGGLGVLLGPSNLIVLDAENQAATDALIAAGLVPVLYTAKGICGAFQTACDPRFDKRGGAHFWIPVPEHLRGKILEGVPQADLGGGALVDVLVGMRQAVVPPTALIAAGGWRYTAKGGNPIWSGEDLPAGDVAAPWLFDATAPCPESVRALHGRIGERVRTQGTAGPRSEASTELSEQLDAVPWDQVLALDPVSRAEDWADDDPECGCAVIHWRGAVTRKSATLHNCDRGVFVRVWSDTAAAELGLGDDQRTMSKAQLAAALLGVPSTGAGFRAVAKRLGVELNGRSLSFADQLDDAAETMEQRAADPARCSGTVSRPDPAAVPQLVSLVDGVQTSRASGTVAVPATEEFWRGEAGAMRSLALLLRGGHHHAEGAVLIGADSVVGAPVPAQPQVATEGEIVDAEVVEEATSAPSSPSTAPAVDDAEEGEAVEEWEGGDQAMWRRHREIEAVLRGERDPETGLWRGMTPGLGRIANLSESRGIYMLGLTEAVLTRVSARIPPHVLFAPRSGIVGSRVEGLGLSYNALLFGAPATGKTTTQVTAAGAVPMTEGIAEIPTGTAEGIVKAARVMVGGSGGSTPRQVMLATNVLSETDEVGNMLSELKRDGSRYIYFINGAFFGNTTLGQTTGEAHRRVSIPAHGARFSQIVGAQPQLCSPIWDTVGTGLDARFACAFTGSVSEEERGPLYHKPVPLLLPNGLPWDPPVGLPMGFRATGKTIEDDETGTSYPELEADLPERRDPEWIFWPKGSEEGRDAAEALSAHRSRFSRQAMVHDLDQRRTEGHEAVRTVKAAALLAALDGLKQPEEIHWRAAQLLTEATILAAAESVAQSDAFDKANDKTAGARRGREYAAGKAAAESATADAVSDAADALYARLTRPTTGVRVSGKLAKGFGGSATYGQLTAASGISRRHRDYIPAGMQLLIQQERVSVAAAGSDMRDYVVTAVGRPAVVAAPAIGTLSA